MKATQRIEERSHNFSLDRNINHEMEDKTMGNSPTTDTLANQALWISVLGSRVLRYGLVLVVGWIGLMKFTAYEATGIQPLVAHSPLLGWMYHLLTVRQFSDGLGAVEVAIAVLIALRPWSAKASSIGSAFAVLMFLTTISFLFSTPGWEPSLGGFPALSASPGQFLLKDVVLLGAALWSLGESVKDILPSNTRIN